MFLLAGASSCQVFEVFMILWFYWLILCFQCFFLFLLVMPDDKFDFPTEISEARVTRDKVTEDRDKENFLIHFLHLGCHVHKGLQKWNGSYNQYGVKEIIQSQVLHKWQAMPNIPKCGRKTDYKFKGTNMCWNHHINYFLAHNLLTHHLTFLFPFILLYFSFYLRDCILITKFLPLLSSLQHSHPPPLLTP